jgi:ArsR family transcriptional regulator, arsenate/arsenite/antimonite-responsive transcriptional repressor
MIQKEHDLGPFLLAISDPTRRRILQALREDNPASGKHSSPCAGDIEERVKLSQPTISHHMKILKKVGVVEVNKQGHFRRYRRNEKLLTELLRELKNQI